VLDIVQNNLNYNFNYVVYKCLNQFINILYIYIYIYIYIERERERERENYQDSNIVAINVSKKRKNFYFSKICSFQYAFMCVENRVCVILSVRAKKKHSP